MLRLVLRLEFLLKRLTGLAGFLGVIAMGLMVMLVFTNVLLRYGFGIGATWSQELQWYLLSVMAMAGIAYAMRYDDHVRVDIFSRKYGRTGRLWLNLLTATVVALPCALLIIYFGYPFAEGSFLRGERSPNSNGMPWRFIPKGLVVVGFAFVATQAVAEALASGRRLTFHYMHMLRS